jgi:hypothetical protein
MMSMDTCCYNSDGPFVNQNSPKSNLSGVDAAPAVAPELPPSKLDQGIKSLDEARPAAKE